jgi:hypothetical protein
LVKTKLLTIFVRSSKSGNDGSLLELKEDDQRVVGG